MLSSLKGNYKKLCTSTNFQRRMASATRLKFFGGGPLLQTDPHTHPVTIIGQLDHLKSLEFDKVKAKFGGRVNEELYNKAVAALSPSPTDSVGLYLNYANLVALPSNGGSRHNTPTRQHCMSKVIKGAVSHVEEEGIVLITPYAHIIPLTAAIARAFPLYNRKTKDADAQHAVNIEYIVTDGELKDEDVITLENVARAVRSAANIVDTPCNELGVDEFVKECQAVYEELVKEHQVSFEAVRGLNLKERGFGGIYNVGKGASPDRQPALVVLKYSCKDDKAKNVAWVGKGIVFDTGGLSIKGRLAMCGMKADCGGAAGVLYSFFLAVKLGIKCNLSAVLCLAENSVSMNSMRVDDVIKLYSGKTVEVNNTDAEGRLVLGDGVAYAKKDLKAEIIVDMATLTSAQAVATGKYHAALVSNKEDFERRFVDAGKRSGDLCHALPYAPEMHFSEFQSGVADMKNAVADASNAASSCAGLFIFSHICSSGFDWEGTWVHVDMAGPVVDKGDRATGYGVLLLNYAFENGNKLFVKY